VSSTVVAVGRVEDFPDGKVSLVEVGSRKVAIVRWQEQVFALRDVCAHQSAPLTKGRLAEQVGSDEVGTVALDSERRPMLVCPWHAWGFDVETGVCTVDSRLRVKVYGVSVRDGVVSVDIRAARQAEPVSD
jgi:nitrite reductase/ring-hydroxylating ferredoxin subunit